MDMEVVVVMNLCIGHCRKKTGLFGVLDCCG